MRLPFGESRRRSGRLTGGRGSLRPRWLALVGVWLGRLAAAHALVAVPVHSARPGVQPPTAASAAPHDAQRADDGLIRSSLGDGLRNGLASGLASATCKTLLHPFDVIKTVEQASKTNLGMMQAMQQVTDETGAMSLFTRGLDVTLIGSVPSIAVYFGAYQFFKKTLSAHLGPAWPHTAVALSAALGNSIAAFFRVPAELVKQRVQAGLHRSAAAAVCSIYKEGGLLAFLEFRSVLAQVRVRVRVRVLVRVRVRVRVRVWVWLCVCVHLCYISSYMQTYMHTSYLHTYIHTHIHTYIHTCMHTYVHTHIHTYIHTCIPGTEGCSLRRNYACSLRRSQVSSASARPN